MHVHASTPVDAGAVLAAVALCSVLAATLFLCRRLVREWTQRQDVTTPATHAGMGLAMVYAMVASPARPVLLVGGAACVLAAGLHARRALGHGRPGEPHDRVHLMATAGTALVMALMLLVVERGAALTAALLACLVVCGVVYAHASGERSGRNRRHPSDLPHLAMTAGMLVMVLGP
jgi:hypothetical protein